MKYSLDVHEFSFNKIKNGTRKIGIHIFDKNAQLIKLYDILDMRNSATGEHLDCKVTGIAIFDNFSDLVDALGPQSLGYHNKNEVMIRLSRLYPAALQNKLNVVAFFLQPQMEVVRHIVRDEMER